MPGHPIVELSSQLGNQLFQYAFGRELAWRSGQDVTYAWKWFDSPGRRLHEVLPEGYPGASRADMLGVGRLLGDQSETTPLQVKLDQAGRLCGVWLSGHMPWPRYVFEGAREFSPDMLAEQGRCVLSGFFQSERYFEHVADDVDRAIQLPVADDALAGLERPIVSVSFRRGDYGKHGALLPPSFYDKGVALMRERVGDMTLVAVGDDLGFIELMAERLSQFGPTVVGSSSDRSDLDDLGLIASADHNIIANSSFAWWGAWLAERRVQPNHHVVIAPRPWFRNRNDVIPERWVTVDWP
jgi:hypothetical protein